MPNMISPTKLWKSSSRLDTNDCPPSNFLTKAFTLNRYKQSLTPKVFKHHQPISANGAKFLTAWGIGSISEHLPKWDFKGFGALKVRSEDAIYLILSNLTRI